MKNKTIFLLTTVSITLWNCTIQSRIVEYDSKTGSKKTPLTQTQLKNWQNLDILYDTIPGLSLNRAYTEIIKNKKGTKTIIAVLDTELDINHPIIKDNLWKNEKEIPNNSIDDDKNGYIDDTDGWNFLSNDKGESIITTSYESTRILNFFKDTPLLTHKDSLIYNKAVIMQKDIDLTYANEKKRIDFYKSVFPECYATIRKIYPKLDYRKEEIDSLYKASKNGDSKKLTSQLYLLNELTKVHLDSSWVSNYIQNFEIESQTLYNKEYKEKSITKDNPYNLQDSIYGSNNISKYAKKTWHSTQVSGLIASCLSIQKNNNLRIMPVVMVAPGGEENDKDIAIAIRYAINNGAKVINMSFGKEISRNSQWIKEALLYAQKKDVLLVGGAGNGSDNTDNGQFYPIDYDEETGKEFTDNLIKVGGISHNLNENLLYLRTNYGKNNVDVFVPAVDLYVPDATAGQTFNLGTSLASALASAVAGIIRSHYPKLTAGQVKQIIIDSGVAYDMEVIMPGTKDTKVKFSELSKSGKVINLYNALLMAKKLN